MKNNSHVLCDILKIYALINYQALFFNTHDITRGLKKNLENDNKSLVTTERNLGAQIPRKTPPGYHQSVNFDAREQGCYKTHRVFSL